VHSCLVSSFVIMASRVKKHLHILKKLRCCRKKEQKAILTKGGKPLQLCLQECALNILKGNVPLSKAQFKKLKNHKNNLRQLSRKRTSHKTRLQIEQKGGFLPLLLAPIVGSLLGGILKR
jgi:hypothetical protein